MLQDDNQLRFCTFSLCGLIFFLLHNNKRKVLTGFIDQMDQMGVLKTGYPSAPYLLVRLIQPFWLSSHFAPCRTSYFLC